MLIWKEVRKIVLQTVPRIFILRTRRGGRAVTGGGWEEPAEGPPPPQWLCISYCTCRDSVWDIGWGILGGFFSALLFKKLKSH